MILRRFFFVGIMFVAFVTTSMAQITLLEGFGGKPLQDSISGNSANSPTVKTIVTESVFPELSILRQQYRLELNGDYYGKDGKPFYGETYSLGIKVSGGMFLLDDVIEPWKDDADYKRVNADGKYKTEYFWTYQRKLSDTTYTAADLEMGTDHTIPRNKDKSLWLHEDKYRGLGLDIDDSVGYKSGFMIWATSKTAVNDSAMKVSLKSSDYSLTARSDTMVIAMSPTDAERTIGGLFVVPKYGNGGRVQFLLAGVAVKNGNSKWALQMLTNKGNLPSASDVSGKPKVSGKTSEPTLSEKKSPSESKTNKKKNKKRKK